MNLPFNSAATSKDVILVVDDSSDNLFLIESILESEGHQLITASDGIEALKRAKQSPPHLILLDVMMPKMDGYEVTQAIRNDDHFPYIPILLITAFDKPSAVKGLDLGADDFIRKPIEVDELLARVRSLLRLKHSVDERENIARQREDFVSRLTHDLRTPMVAADRMLSLMLKGTLGELPSAMEEAITTMSRSNRNLLEMVNTLLEVYRYEADRKTFHFSALDLSVLIEEVLAALEPLAIEKGLALTFDNQLQATSDNGTPPAVIGDRLEILRLLTNLIGNALKFTDQGEVSVNLKPMMDESPSRRSWLVCQISDTGPGISIEDQKVLFNRFQTGRHRRSGSGLGLHLSRQIVETHQGTLEMQSELGQGSVFTFCLPARTLLNERDTNPPMVHSPNMHLPQS